VRRLPRRRAQGLLSHTTNPGGTRDACPPITWPIPAAIAVAMLFVTGYTYGRLTGYRPVWVGVSMVVLGGVLVGLTIALGG